MGSTIHSLSYMNNGVNQETLQDRQVIASQTARPVTKEEGRVPSKLEVVVEPSVSKLSQAVDGLNGALEVVRTHLRFRLHEDIDQYYVEVVDTMLGEVIREIPPKRFLDMVADMYQFMGMLVDEKR